MKYKAKIIRSINAWIHSHDEDFAEEDVNSFEEALEMCKSIGSFSGIIKQSVKFINIDKEKMTAIFIVKDRMRYEDDTFYLSLTLIINNSQA